MLFRSKTDWGVYGIIDQLVWRMPDSKGPKGIGVFARMIGGPTEQNLVDFYADGGITFSGMFPHRPNDILAAGFAYTGISNDVRGSNGSQGLANAGNFEALFEVCYTAQLNPGWTFQPDFQYIWQPEGGASEPSGKTVPNAAVWGVRTTINF